MSNRKSTARRRTAKKSGGGSVWPWVLMLGVVAGGIQAYEHRDSLLPQRHVVKATYPATSSPKVATAAKRDSVTPEKVAFAWRSVVGPAIDHATSVEWHDGVLHVRARDRAWQREVERSAALIRSRLDHLLGDRVVRYIDVKNT